MYGFFNHIDKFRRYGVFSAKEKRWLLISAIIMTFLVGFDDGSSSFEIVPWLQHLSLSFIAVAIAIIVHQTVQRFVGVEAGFRIEHKPSIYGLIAGFIIAFMSNGKLIFLSYGGFEMHTLEKHRLGYFRYHKGYFQQGKIAAAGPVANLFVAIIAKQLIFLPEPLINSIVLVNVLFAITNLLPIPPMDGVHVVFASRMAYLWIFGAVTTTGILLLYSNINIVYTLMAAAVGAVITALFYFRNIEPKIAGSWEKK